MSSTNLLDKLRKVASEIDFVEKTGHNAHHNYSYAQSVDVVRQVRERLLAHGVLLLPGDAFVGENVELKNGSLLTFVNLRYVVFDVDSGESYSFSWVGSGADKGGDKGIYKAYTGGLKYALLSLFLIPTSDDPERDQLTEHRQTEERDPAPRIPPDRAAAILRQGISVNLIDQTDDGYSFHPAFQACLALHGATKIGELSVDAAEAVEVFLASEAS